MINKETVFLLLVLIFLLLTGCATKMQMNVDGMPMPNTTFVVKNEETGIRAEAYMARMIRKDNGGESEVAPADYLEIENKEIHELDPDTVSVSGKVRIINPQNKKYFIKVIYTLDYPGKKFPYVVSHVLYEGKAREKIFDINRNVEKSRPEVECCIMIDQGEFQFKKDESSPMFNICTTYQVIRQK